MHVINSLETGGAQTLVEALCLVAESNHDVHVVVLLGRDTLSARVEAAAASVTYLNLRKDPISAGVGVVRLRRILRQLRPDVIHSHLLQADLIASLAKGRTALVSTVHTSGGHESGLGSALVTRVMRLVAHRYSALVACSPSAGRFAKTRLNRAPDATILNGTRLPEFDMPYVPEESSVVLSLARWHPMKDHANLFAAVSHMGASGPRLVCAGAGMSADNPEVVALTAQFPGIDIELRGPVEDVASLIQGARALVVASSHGEALPMAGIESLAHGVPVVTTDVGDCSLLAIDEAQLVPPRDPIALASALTEIFSEQAHAQLELRARARRRAEDLFDVTSAARTYYAIYEGIAR
ncbi:glycosyltransferase involved in cell wall biosynthesis [Microbacterium sp. BE35]|uniref:glycosyltransferase n=1 Tax=Microbacterium sp. BE35 TaxID=2817773 RepID=UPI00285E601C|nr:glycosyltransferase [Microbacterium sp. BE35]MDR7188702.1 glycosyltransferase involved in cell wall biosynthesis [Microbacterium sp. BE35]